MVQYSLYSIMNSQKQDWSTLIALWYPYFYIVKALKSVDYASASNLRVYVHVHTFMSYNIIVHSDKKSIIIRQG